MRKNLRIEHIAWGILKNFEKNKRGLWDSERILKLWNMSWGNEKILKDKRHGGLRSEL
jgi:hypothetical protein